MSTSEYTVEIVLADGSIYPHSGKLTFAEPSFDAQTGTFLIRATVDNPKGVLRPNQYVRIHLKGAVRPKAILVPQRAVQQSSKGHFVWVVKDGKAEQRPVITGEWQGENWVIYEGLHPGDQVAVEGTLLLTLRPGASVMATPLAADAGAEDAPAADKRSVKRGG
jgi:membrane fusion protein (multidrug efflux system)